MGSSNHYEMKSSNHLVELDKILSRMNRDSIHIDKRSSSNKYDQLTGSKQAFLGLESNKNPSFAKKTFDNGPRNSNAQYHLSTRVKQEIGKPSTGVNERVVQAHMELQQFFAKFSDSD